MATSVIRKAGIAIAAAVLTSASLTAGAADQALLEILLTNGVITQGQYEQLIEKEAITAQDLALKQAREVQAVEERVAARVEAQVQGRVEKEIEETVDEVVVRKASANFPILSEHGSKGFRFTTRDGLFSTALQWRAQMRYTNPSDGDLRQVDDFEDDPQSTFQLRRVRMKIGGHAFQPWLGYYFEVDLQPSRDVDDDSESASSRVIDWRITLDKYEEVALRVGQWKIDYNRERVDSSGKQQFVERSIVNRIFTIDRQMGVQLRGRLFPGTRADMRYWAGVFTGEGRGVANDDDDMMYMGRLQWNFMGRDLKWQQSDVERTSEPTGSLAFAAATNQGRCTRWSSGGCGNLDGFTRPSNAVEGQFQVDQMMQEFAFKWNGLSIQEEFHWKTVEDRANNTESDFTGAYAQVGYFFNELFPAVPAPLELAFRYAFVEEPNELNIAEDNLREEFIVGANWFFAGHRNKFTVDYSHLTLDDAVLDRNIEDDRIRFQWDISM